MVKKFGLDEWSLVAFDPNLIMGSIVDELSIHRGTDLT